MRKIEAISDVLFSIEMWNTILQYFDEFNINTSGKKKKDATTG